MELTMEHSIDYTMDTFFGKLAISPDLVNQNDTLSVFSYVKFLERKVSILEDIVSTSHTIAEINQTLQSNPNQSFEKTIPIQGVEIGVQTDFVKNCACHEAPKSSQVENLNPIEMADSLLLSSLEPNLPENPDTSSKFSPLSLSSFSSLTIGDIGKSNESLQNCIEPFEMIDGNPFDKFCVDTLIEELDFSHTFSNRKAVYFGEFDYEYSGGIHKAQDIPPKSYLANICSYLEVVLPEFYFNSVLVNFYGSRTDCLPRHSDNEDCIDEKSNILTLSLGATRTMQFTSMSTGSTVADVELSHGEILLMSKQSQRFYQHELLPSPTDDASRVSLTLRLIKEPICRNAANDEINEIELNSNASGYVPYRMHEPFPVRSRAPIQSNNHQTWTKPTEPKYSGSVKQATHWDKSYSHHKPDCLYISSSLFRDLNEHKMSSSEHTAKVLFYPGANSEQMLKRLLQDREFQSLDKGAIKQIYILTGTNYVDSLYSGDLTYETAVTGVNEMCSKLWEIFVDAKINVVNILPRADRDKNVYVDKLNESIREMCFLHGLNFVDTESKNRLFTETNGIRKQQYFKYGYFDNVHLNLSGIARLGRHLKYLTHIR